MIELVDTSAWAWRERDRTVKAAVDAKLLDDEVATCDAVRLELLYSARNADEFKTIRSRLDALIACPVGPGEWARALNVYERLAEQGGAHQRQVKHMDLLVAAAAESAGVPVLHCDEDFERIARVTRQPTRWASTRPG